MHQKEPLNKVVNRYITQNDYGTGEVRSWASLIDENCLLQAQAISRVPILEGYLALMPDAHFGFGPPVGSALKTRDAVMPYAVGVDIGCGMIAVKTNLTREQLAGHEQKILRNIREYIPSGVGRGHKEGMTVAGTAFVTIHGKPPGEALARAGLTDIAINQFGTLGAGNHFAEVSEDTDGAVWLIVHSGSRGVGNQLATVHVKRAQEMVQAKGLESKEFAFFTSGQIEFREYLADMLWCQAYALEQREAMMDALIRSVAMGAGVIVHTEMKVNCHHNYAEELEPGLWLTRKGAIDASEGKLGVIPGSMGVATYIVQGKGNAESYNTSPHGAGRLLGRNVAKKTLNLDDFKAQMAGKFWLSNDATALLDEAPSAYKPIEVVIADSADLVEPVAVLSQFINYKGL